METSKLVETLRFCGDKESCCTNCPSGDRVTEYTATECLCDLMQKAANAIEELESQLKSQLKSQKCNRDPDKRNSLQATSDGWIPVTERLPENEVDVLILAERRLYGIEKADRKTVRLVAAAFHTDGKMNTEESGYNWELDNVDMEYDEDADAFIVPEGWWEAVRYGEEFSAVDDFVTHWMPLPQPPKGE